MLKVVQIQNKFYLFKYRQIQYHPQPEQTIIIMKTGQSTKISPYNSTQSSVDKKKSINSLFKQICSSDLADHQQFIPSKQIGIQKKIIHEATNLPNITVEKTLKIKKNQKRQKKKISIDSPNIQIDKSLLRQHCTCCTNQLDNTLTHDGFESEDEYYSAQSSQLKDIIISKGKKIILSYFEKVDKIVNILNSSECCNLKIFSSLIQKLATLYQKVEQNFSTQIEIYRQEIEEPMESFWSLDKQFQDFILNTFPLLKDFIQHFRLSDLSEKQEEHFRQIRNKSGLIQCIFTHIEAIQAKKIKKKIKRQQQKLNKKLTNNFTNNQTVFTEFVDIAQEIKSMTINRNERDGCFYNEKWLEKLRSKYNRPSRNKQS